MLHKQPIDNQARADLERVYAVKLNLFKWLLKSPKAPLTDQDWTTQFGNVVGKWFVKRLKRTKKGVQIQTAWAKHVDALIALSLKDATYASKVFNVLKNDAEVGTNWTYANYVLQFVDLDTPWRTAVAGVSEAFYDWFCKSGFDKKTFSLSGEKLNRLSWLRGINKHANGHCGYCGGEIGDDAVEKLGADCEHFFPRDHWPHLCIHPFNLYLACGDCNSTRKGQKHPVPPGPNMLQDTYHPELRPAEPQLQVKVTRNPTASKGWDVNTFDVAFPKRRDNMVSLLELEDRWKDRLSRKDDKWMSEWTTSIKHAKRAGGTITLAWVQGIVDDKTEQCRKNPFADAHMRLCQAYCEFVASNQAELQALAGTPNPVPFV